MATRRAVLIAGALALTGCTRQKWNGFHFFTRGDPSGIPLVVAPVGPRGLGDWIGEKTISNFVSAGFYVLGVHWTGLNGRAEDYGARSKLIDAWMRDMGLQKPMLYAQSRGGLQLLNYACDHPDSFDRIAALYPVTDPLVYPGAISALWNAYGTTEEQFPEQAFSPNLKASSLRGRPIKVWHGDSDKLVPKNLTTDVFAPQCGAEVITLPGVGHIPLWLDDIASWLKHPPSPAWSALSR